MLEHEKKALSLVNEFKRLEAIIERGGRTSVGQKTARSLPSKVLILLNSLKNLRNKLINLQLLKKQSGMIFIPACRTEAENMAVYLGQTIGESARTKLHLQLKN
jgi:hypothetical protein